MAVTIKYPDEKIMSIGSLKMKNKQYIKTLEDIVLPNVSRYEMYESFIIDTAFGNRVIKGSIVSSDFAKILSKDSREIESRIQENNEAIKRIIRSLPLYSLSEADINALLTEIEGPQDN